MLNLKSRLSLTVSEWVQQAETVRTKPEGRPLQGDFFEKETSIRCSPSAVHTAVRMNLKEPCLFGMQCVLCYFFVLAA